jgi:hypothetical protein
VQPGGEALKPNKTGYQFNLGGGVGSIHAYEEMYWSNSDCRKDMARPALPATGAWTWSRRWLDTDAKTPWHSGPVICVAGDVSKER